VLFRSDKVLALGKKLHVNGTPNLIFANGTQSPGLLPAAELERNLNETKER
jgi:thiol:disulfide interchange protein DsbC